ncbi:MAG: SDR family NAD(P)-dependent oxidoreductase [Betaproteobacteria bacterium]|nr:MAG: SDR family NAD(P)-dependent oxidoreductase [Betaproteobacteria bacterium]
MPTIMITGATRGFGLAVTRALNATGDVDLILAVRDSDAGNRLAAQLSPKARVVALDVSSRRSIQALVNSWDRPLHALVNNAGLQFTGPMAFSEDGTEMTLAVNHLGPLELTLGLLPWLKGGRVMGIGSGTHNPDNAMARAFGFRGGHFTSIEQLARGDSERAGDRQRGMDLYATSKLLSMVSMVEMARHYHQPSFLTLDPGLMPGTGLLRTAPLAARLAWNSLLRWLVPVLPDSSTPERSAKAAQSLLLNIDPAPGEIYAFDGRPSRRVWSMVRDKEFGHRVLNESLRFLGISRQAEAARA